jgi:acyl carrier protein
MVFDKIAEIIADKLDIDQDLIKLESSFDDMHVDSLYMVEILLSVEDEFGVVIEDASEMKTVADLCAFVEEKEKA